jgi:hypothetical protein
MSELNKRGQSIFNTSEIIINRQKKRELRDLKKLQINKDISSIVLLEKENLINDVMLYISKLIVKNRTSSLTSSTEYSSSHIRDPNNFNNFNKKKILKIIEDERVRYGFFLPNNSKNYIISEIKNMNGLIIPKNRLNDIRLTTVQLLITKYYTITSILDGYNIKSFNQALNSSRFKMKKSDEQFFVTIKDRRNLQDYSNSIIALYEFADAKISNNEFQLNLILTLRHIHFKEKLKEDLYKQAKYKNYNLNHIIREQNNYIEIIDKIRNQDVVPILTQQLLNIAEIMINKTYNRIIKEFKKNKESKKKILNIR